MGIGGISIWQLLIVLLIVVLIFGTKKLKSMGNDLGGAVKGFKDAMDKEEGDKDSEEQKDTQNLTKDEASTDTDKVDANKDKTNV